MLSGDVTTAKPVSGSDWLLRLFIRPTQIIWIILLANFVVKMVEENHELTLQDLRPFLVYAQHLGFKNSIRNKKRYFQNFLAEVIHP